MPKHLQNLSPEAIAMLIFITCATAIHFGGNWLKRFTLDQRETQILQRDPPAPANQPKAGAIHIIREAQDHPAPPPSQPAPEINTNQIFEKSSPPGATNNKPEPEAEVKINYFEQLTANKDKHLQLNALMHNGAMINGRFIPLNTSVDSVAYPASAEDPNNPSKLIAPLLVAVDHAKQTATLANPTQKHQTITLTLN